MNQYQPEPAEEIPPLILPPDPPSALDVYVFESADLAEEVARLRGEMSTLIAVFQTESEEYRRDVSQLAESKQEVVVQLRRSQGQLLQVVRALRAIIVTGNGMAEGRTPTIEPGECQRVWREAEEVLTRCGQIE